MSKTSAGVNSVQEVAARLAATADLSYELEVALMSLRLIEAGGGARVLARGALGLIAPKAYPQYEDEAADLAVMLFAAPRGVDGGGSPR
jgi:hypothetical protein